jgi:hypothetical protein
MSGPSPSRPKRDPIRAGESVVSARTLAVAVVISLAVLSVTAPFAAAAGGTTVSIVPADDSIEVGETTTIDVVVDDADGGAGAAEFRVSLADTAVARLTDVTVLGSGRVEQTVADDGSWIEVQYAFADTADTGSVVVAEVTVEGVADGSTDIALEPAEGNDATVVYDEAGTGYRVTGTDGVRLSVGDGVAIDVDEGVDLNENAPPSVDAETDQPQSAANDDTDGADEADATGGAGGSNTAGDADGSDAGPSADSADASSDSESRTSSGVEEPASERSDDAGAATTFGTALDADGVERAVGAVSGPVGLVAAVAIGFLLGIGYHRRR